MSKCICCDDLNYNLDNQEHHLEFGEGNPQDFDYYFVQDSRLEDWELYICPRCSSVIKASQETSDNLKGLLSYMYSCSYWKYEIKQQMTRLYNEVALNGLKGTIKSEDNVCKKIFKEISKSESKIKRCIKKIEYYYSFVELELVLFALKSTASDYFQLSGSGIVNLFNIKPYIIQKYRKLKNITGSGYNYKPKEIKEILELSK